MIFRRQTWLAVAIALTGLWGSPAAAFKLEPIARTFRPTGPQATQSYQVVNDGDELIAIQVSFVTRHIDEAGQEHYSPADEDFLAFPPHILLEPQASQTLRVTWLGDPDPAQELAYRMVVEQLPIDLPTEGEVIPTGPEGRVRVMMRYLGSVFVRPTTVAPEVQVTAQAIAPSETGPQLTVTLHNAGTGHARLRQPALRFQTGAGTPVELSGNVLADLNQTVILPGQSRTFLVPWTGETGDVVGTGEYTGQF